MPLQTKETRDAVLLAFPMNNALNDQLKATFPAARFDKPNGIWVVPTANDAEKTKVDKFLPDLAKQVDAAEQSFKNARSYVEAHDPAKFPGLRLEARSERLAVFTVGPDGKGVGVRSAIDQIKQIPGAAWVREWTGADKSGETVTRGGYWAVPMPEGRDPTVQLTLAAGEMAKFGREIGLVQQLQPAHPGMTVSSASTKDGPVAVLSMARDPNANTIAKVGGFTWNRDLDGYVMPLNDQTVAKGRDAIAKLDSYMESMALQPTLSQNGLTDKALAGASALKGGPEEASLVKDYRSLIDGALTPTEQKLIADSTAATYKDTHNERISAIPADRFDAVRGALANVGAVHGQQQDRAMQAALAEINRVQDSPQMARS
jgi:hypothetical protein